MDPQRRDLIVDTALRLADRCSWEALRLYDVAQALGTGLAEIHQYFAEKEDIVAAWFDRADAAMLQQAQRPEFRELGSHDRLVQSLMTWLLAMSRHRRLTRQMIANKFEPGHLHYQRDGARRVSRTVQWWREAAGRDAVLPWRALEETALTGIFLTAFCYWLRDDSPDAGNTRALLARLVAGGAQLADWLPGYRRATTTSEVPP